MLHSLQFIWHPRQFTLGVNMYILYVGNSEDIFWIVENLIIRLFSMCSTTIHATTEHVLNPNGHLRIKFSTIQEVNIILKAGFGSSRIISGKHLSGISAVIPYRWNEKHFFFHL